MSHCVSRPCFVCIYYLSYALYLPRPSLLFLNFIALKLYLVNNESTKSKAPYYAVLFSLLLTYFLLELNILLSTRFPSTLIRIISRGRETKFHTHRKRKDYSLDYLKVYVCRWSRDIVVGIATGYGLDDRVRVPVG
jgi:hypothetical protein